ncbi:hypothetical protein GW932_01155 [archaeon]|nr:hypothetical protein [archaeon]
MEYDEQIKKALETLREGKERKFDQTVDLIINLQKYSVKKNPINLFVNVPHKAKDKKVAAFLEADSELIDTITLNEFNKYNDKKALKKLVDKYDFFIAQGKIMPKVATVFGRVLGPAGKMPSPQLGIILNADEKTISELKDKINTSVKIRVKESSVKVPVGKQSMKDEDIMENINAIYIELLKNLPRDKENIKNIEVKFTMTKPIKIHVR